jgi:hypothetical protein
MFVKQDVAGLVAVTILASITSFAVVLIAVVVPEIEATAGIVFQTYV